MARAWRTPIEFYGKIVDEEGNPISGVKIRFTASDESKEGTSVYYKESDAKGRFELRGKEGKSIEVEIANPDFYASRKNPQDFELADSDEKNFYEPNFAKPVLFVMRKRGLSEPLIKNSRKWDLSTEGEQLAIDLVGNRRAKGNDPDKVDLIVSYRREPVIKGVEPKWTLTFDVPGNYGGIKRSQEEFMFLAPLEGYEKHLVLGPSDFKSGHPFPTDDIYFYLCSRNGKNYARVKIRFGSFVGRAEIDPRTGTNRYVGELTLSYFLNPKGSPNLEYAFGNEIGVKILYEGLKLDFPTKDDLNEAKELYFGKNTIHLTMKFLQPTIFSRLRDWCLKSFGDTFGGEGGAMVVPGLDV